MAKPITKFIAIDLELNGKENEKYKIIQVGVCVADRDQSEEEWELHSWDIKIDKPIYPFITELTGITTEQNQNGLTHQEVYDELKLIMSDSDIFINPVTWGGGDVTSLVDEFKERGIDCQLFGRRWIDVKTIHTALKMGSRSYVKGGLESIMRRDYKMKFEGEAHRASTDAYNTMRLYFKLLDRFELWQGITEILKRE